MKHTGERMTPEVDKGNLIYYEHITRYKFASQFIKGKNVLDLACGEGYGSDLLLKSGAKKVVGVDISTETVNHAKNKYKSKNLSFIQSDAVSLPFEDKTFDIVVSFETIEHLKDQDKFISEIKRVLTKNGLAIISTPNARVYEKGNIFHIKELTIKAFENLIMSKFKHYKLLTQDNYSANCISDVSINQTTIDSNKLSNKKNDRYLISLASNYAIPDHINVVSLFDKDLPRLYESTKTKLKEKEDELNSIYKSRGWKIISKVHKLRIKIPFIKSI